MSNREAVFAELAGIMTNDFELDPKSVNGSARLIDDLDLDSIDAVDLSVKVQHITGRKFTDDEIRNLRTVDDIVDLIVRIRPG